MSVPGMPPRLLDKFDTLASDYLVAQGSRIRELEDAMRDESTAMLKLLRDQVCAEVSATNAKKSGLEIVINELFVRPEVRKGLVEWLPKEEGRTQASTFVEHLRDDIMGGEGNNARTTLNKLLPLYMDALNVPEFLQKFGNKVPGSSPGGKKKDPQRKLLGYLVHEMRAYLEAILMAYGDAVGEEEADLKETTKRLRTALYACLNMGNVASHNREKLSYCQRLELCGAVGAMAETLPVVFQAYQDIKAAQTTKGARRVDFLDGNGDFRFIPSGNQVETFSKQLPFRIRLPHEMETKSEDESGIPSGFIDSLDTTKPQSKIQIELKPVLDSSCEQKNIVAYYKNYLFESPDKTQAKYEVSLKRMNLVSKARLCAKASCSDTSCSESHATNEALSYNPLVMTLACPVPKDCWNDHVHEKKLCLFNHGEYRGAGEFRFYKKLLCGSRAECTNTNCLRSHSVAEICWFNPAFRTKDCPHGKGCTRRRNCTLFHKEYHNTKRLSRDDFIDAEERMLFFDRTLRALKWDADSGFTDLSSTVPRLVQYYDRFIQLMSSSSSDQDKYVRVLRHMQKVSKARMCMEGENCNRRTDSDENQCTESHDMSDALSFNPLAMVLACPTPQTSRDDFIHENGLCLFYHGESGVSKEFLKAKRLLCENLDCCDDGQCMKSHSIVEACWFYPTFRIKSCPQGDLCKRMRSCFLFHSECHEQRDADMNDTVGIEEPVLFIERSYPKLNHPLQEVYSDTASCDLTSEAVELPEFPLSFALTSPVSVSNMEME